jgi:uncharacterized ferritin-like protein (DUF455 family)
LESSLFENCHSCLIEQDIDAKLACVQQLAQRWYQHQLTSRMHVDLQTLERAGLPENIRLVHPTAVPRRRIGTSAGMVALLHAVAHIEFNAINLALDAVYRFQDMPAAYYADWLRIACEECYHFTLVRHRLHKMDTEYGDLPAHEGLWEVAKYSANDILTRMALVPRVLEARGLDVTPGIVKRVLRVGETATADILSIILRDEIGHVAAGSRWFQFVCKSRNLPVAETFDKIIRLYMSDMNAHIKGPFYIEARKQAGFSNDEIEILYAAESLT